MTRPPRNRRSRRRGAITAEALVIIPILILMTVAIVEFAAVLSVKQAGTHAVVQATREAAKGATMADIEAVIEDELQGWSITIGDKASFRYEDPELMINQTQGTLACTAPSSSVTAGNIRVTVCVSTTNTPIVNQLQKLGFSDLINKTLTNSAVVKKECP